MFNRFIKLIIGDLDKKREYKQMMKRVNALPHDYKFAFKQIQKYIYTVGATDFEVTMFTDMIKDMTIFTDLIDLFEISVADKRQVIDVTGSDICKFCDEFMSAYITNPKTLGEKLNKEIMEKFNKEGRK